MLPERKLCVLTLNLQFSADRCGLLQEINSDKCSVTFCARCGYQYENWPVFGSLCLKKALSLYAYTSVSEKLSYCRNHTTIWQPRWDAKCEPSDMLLESSDGLQYLPNDSFANKVEWMRRGAWHGRLETGAK